MTFVKVPGLRGKVYVPEKKTECQRKHDCEDCYSCQVFPFKYRPRVMKQIARFVAPGGTLLVICRGREPQESEGLMPWPLMKEEFEILKACSLNEVLFEDFLDEEDPPARRFRAAYGHF